MTANNAVIKAVLEAHSMDCGDSNFMDTIRACIPLYGDAIIQKWKQQAAHYPEALALKNIQQHITAFDAAQPAVVAHRDNPTVFYAAISRLQEAMFLVLLALNRLYFPTFKSNHRAPLQCCGCALRPQSRNRRWPQNRC